MKKVVIFALCISINCILFNVLCKAEEPTYSCGKTFFEHHGGFSLIPKSSEKRITKFKAIKKIKKTGKGRYSIITKSLRLHNNLKKKKVKTKPTGYEGTIWVDGPLVFGAGTQTIYRNVMKGKLFGKGYSTINLKLTKKELKEIKKARLSENEKKKTFEYWMRKGEMAMEMTAKEADKEFKERYYKKGKYYYPYLHASIRLCFSQATYIDLTDHGGGYSGHEGWGIYCRYQNFKLKTY